ncbi:hypothetical protein EDD70_2332 [Hydrogenoanaerobacterium saccharovorans]|uniref:TRASH domain-containing protein n=1 Tax=Hydrogenoanaerobacterium saccharovorans TaxID=474960 RepID=A0A1H8CZB0_9FIRM|nr:hypothetical protein [Hydrogenoanaerobacterium saccharovorans]RPF43368.1 hypothetical protein EDD70_2332 [Hydrogenoanaerobacterium saccharovorans]SEM99688.1 hypothetical protein SAMN05216180_2390 [Hydrogenoanaerobacterium saccharovorans]
MKYLRNEDGEIVTCKTCKQALTDKMELEYSQEATELFCSPNCAMDFYFNRMESKPVTFEEALELIK